jgi:hypothetical protein
MTIRRAEFISFGARDIHMVPGTPGNSLLNRFRVDPVEGPGTALIARRAAAFDYEFRPTFKATRKNGGRRRRLRGLRDECRVGICPRPVHAVTGMQAVRQGIHRRPIGAKYRTSRLKKKAPPRLRPGGGA